MSNQDELRLKAVLAEYNYLTNSVQRTENLRTTLAGIMLSAIGVISAIAFRATGPWGALILLAIPVIAYVWFRVVATTYWTSLGLSKYIRSEFEGPSEKMRLLLGHINNIQWLHWETHWYEERKDLILKHLGLYQNAAALVIPGFAIASIALLLLQYPECPVYLGISALVIFASFLYALFYYRDVNKEFEEIKEAHAPMMKTAKNTATKSDPENRP